ncbi:MAG: tetratricopeptide repeat protein [Myxococcota bacterium]
MTRPTLFSAALISLALTAPLTAQAKKSLSDVLGNVESVQISGVVEVPLYMSPDGSVLPCVRVTIDEKDYTFGLDFGDEIGISEATARALGLESKDNEISRLPLTVKTTTVAEMRIGDMVLSNITSQIGYEDDSYIDDAEWYIPLPQFADVDGTIGLGALGVAYAILPSKGVVRFAPREQEQRFIDELGGASVLEMTIQPEAVRKFGKEKVRLPGVGYFTIQVNGAPRTMSLSTFSWGSSIRSGVEMGAAPRWGLSDMEAAWIPVQIGDQPTIEGWMGLAGALQYLQYPQLEWEVDGVLGLHFLSNFDIAGSREQLAFKYITEAQRNPSLPLEIEDIQAALDEAKQKREEAKESGEVEEEDAENPHGKTQQWMRLAQLQARAGEMDAALTTMKTVMEYEDAEDACANWMMLGDLQKKATQLDGALTSYGTAAELYHMWWDNSLEERNQIDEDRAQLEEDRAKLEKKGGDPDSLDDPWPKKQPGRCHEADGHVAHLSLAAGELERVANLFDERLDLDPALALAQGNAALTQGNITLAQHAYRQALQLESIPSSYSRMGLAMSYHSNGRWDTASGLYQKAINLDRFNIMLALTWTDAQIVEFNPAYAMRKAKSFMEQNPGTATGYVAYARAARSGGDADAMAEATRRGDQFFNNNLIRYPNSARFTAAHAAFLYETDRADAARTAAEQALQWDPDNTVALLTLGALHVESGEIDKGETMLRQAGQMGLFHPGYAMLIQAQIPRPVAPDPDMDDLP